MKQFNSIDEMLSYMQARGEEADSRVEAWQSVKPGDYFIRLVEMGGDEVIIYGKVLDPIQEEINAGADEDEVAYQRELRDEPHMKHYRFARCYSELCPEGEYGDVHISTIALVITEGVFKSAQDAGWPSDPRQVAGLVINAGGGVG